VRPRSDQTTLTPLVHAHLAVAVRPDGGRDGNRLRQTGQHRAGAGRPNRPVQYYDLELPADLEIKAVDFSATTYADVSGPPEGAVGSTVSGRAFVNVYAVHRTTGEQFLVLYEDVGRRSRPVQIIRFVPGTDPARP